MTRGQDFIKKAKFSHGHRSAMSNSAWCDLNKNVPYSNYTICAIIPNVSVRNRLLSVPINFEWKAQVLKIQ